MKAFVVERPLPEALRALNYAPALERIRRTGSKSARPLRAIARTFGGGYGTMFTRIDCAPAHGVPLLSQTDTFAAEPLGRIIRRDSMPYPARHEVRRWQILISGAGQMGEGNLFGRAIIADTRLEGGFVGPDTFLIEAEEPESDFTLWTYAFLNSSIGLEGVRAAAYGTSIPHLRPDLLGRLPIPVAPRDLTERVAQLVRRAVKSREAFLNKILEARRLIGELSVTQSATEMCAERRRRTVRWVGPLPTLCAWNAISSGGALDYLSKKWHTRLGDVVEPDGIYNGPRFARIDCQPPHGVELMSQRDAMLIRPSPRRVGHPGFDDRLLFAAEGTILAGGHGTLGEGEIFGRAVLVHGRYSRAAFTQDLLRIVAKPKHQNSLYAYLTTTLGFRLLRTTAVGTKLLLMREDLLRSLPVPDWPADLEARVESAVRSAFRERSIADEAETEAIRVIEDEVLPQWLA